MAQKAKQEGRWRGPGSLRSRRGRRSRCMALTIPVVRPLVLALGHPILHDEIVGLTFISVMSGDSLIKRPHGRWNGDGCFLCRHGSSNWCCAFAFNQLYLFDGINIVTIVIGIFAMAEVIDMGIKGGSIAHTQPRRM